jgi:anti-sigma-K factor RskA
MAATFDDAIEDVIVAEVRSLREAASLLVLGLDAVTPDARVWPRLEGGLVVPPMATPGSLPRRARPERGVAARRRAHAIATLGLASAAVFAVLWREARVGALAARERSARLLTGSAQRVAPLRSPDVTFSTFRGREGGIAQIIAEDGGRRWVVIAVDLPPVEAHVYQLWFLPPEGEPIPAGLLQPAEDGTLDVTATVPGALGRVRPAISLEPTGGSVRPTTVKMVGDVI